jgi:hypothetical protein
MNALIGRVTVEESRPLDRPLAFKQNTLGTPNKGSPHRSRKSFTYLCGQAYRPVACPPVEKLELRVHCAQAFKNTRLPVTEGTGLCHVTISVS